MIYRFLPAAALSMFATTIICSDVAQAEPEICQRLKEITSYDPHKNPLFHYKTREARCRTAYWLHLQPLPLSELLNEAERAEYDEAISKQNCDAAAVLLSKRFVEAHPHAPSILENTKDYKKWESVTIGKHFPELALCFGLEELRKAQNKMDRLGITAEPYAGLTKTLEAEITNRLPVAVLERNSAIFSLHVDLNSSLSHDIALALLKLSVEGKALKYHPWHELYMAYKLRHNGLQDPIIQQVIDRPLDSKVKADVEQQVISGRYEGIPQFPD